MQPITLQIGHSQPLRIVFIGVHLCIALYIGIVAVAQPWQLLLLLVTIVHGGYYWRKRSELGGKPIQIRLQQNGWQWLQSANVIQPLQLRHWFLLAPDLVILQWRLENQRFSTIAAVVWGQIPAETLRQLRVYLLHGTHTVSER